MHHNARALYAPPSLVAGDELDDSPCQGQETTLYRLWTKPGDGWRLLYVGISRSWPNRMKEHRESKLWWWAVDRVDIETFCCERHAARAERVAIRSEHPIHNVTHNLEVVPG